MLMGKKRIKKKVEKKSKEKGEEGDKEGVIIMGKERKGKERKGKKKEKEREMVMVKVRMLYYVWTLRLRTFSKKHAYIFTGSNRAESGDDNDTKFTPITLVEGEEMIVEVDGILVHLGSMPRALQFPPAYAKSVTILPS
jgi:hypothetical protein